MVVSVGRSATAGCGDTARGVGWRLERRARLDRHARAAMAAERGAPTGAAGLTPELSASVATDNTTMQQISARSRATLFAFDVPLDTPHRPCATNLFGAMVSRRVIARQPCALTWASSARASRHRNTRADRPRRAAVRCVVNVQFQSRRSRVHKRLQRLRSARGAISVVEATQSFWLRAHCASC
jgi:hypothetical protein